MSRVGLHTLALLSICETKSMITYFKCICSSYAFRSTSHHWNRDAGISVTVVTLSCTLSSKHTEHCENKPHDIISFHFAVEQIPGLCLCLYLFTLNPTHPVLTECTACSPVLIKNSLSTNKNFWISRYLQLSYLPLTMIKKSTGSSPH